MQPDYTKMDGGGDLHAALGTDARNWTKAFRQINPDSTVDDNTMLGWFANAIMAGHDAALGNPPLNGDHAEYLLGKD